MRDNFHKVVNNTWYSILFDHKVGAKHSGKVLIIIIILFLIIIIIISNQMPVKETYITSHSFRGKSKAIWDRRKTWWKLQGQVHMVWLNLNLKFLPSSKKKLFKIVPGVWNCSSLLILKLKYLSLYNYINYYITY